MGRGRDQAIGRVAERECSPAAASLAFKILGPCRLTQGLTNVNRSRTVHFTPQLKTLRLYTNSSATDQAALTKLLL
jgi:hypothetical protein